MCIKAQWRTVVCETKAHSLRSKRFRGVNSGAKNYRAGKIPFLGLSFLCSPAPRKHLLRRLIKHTDWRISQDGGTYADGTLWKLRRGRLSEKSFVLFIQYPPLATLSLARPNIFYPEIHSVQVFHVI